jgi:hypothetical protein
MKMHKSITVERITDACKRSMTSLDNPGFCVKCGNEQEGCEPDARRYECEACGAKAVYGAEELLLHIAW